MAQNLRDKIFTQLAHHAVPYELLTHDAVYTCEAAAELSLPAQVASLKNVFLRNQKRTHFYLLLLDAAERVDFALLKDLTGHRLSFASPEELADKLAVAPGAVSPLCLLNDPAQKIMLLVSETLLNSEDWSMHPGVCTETVLLRYRELAALIPHFNNITVVAAES